MLINASLDLLNIKFKLRNDADFEMLDHRCVPYSSYKGKTMICRP